MMSAIPETIEGRSVVVQRTPPATLYEYLVGGFAATIFSSMYIITPLWLISVPVSLVLYPGWWFTWFLTVIFVISAFLPTYPSKSFLRTWPFKHLPKYFDYTEIKEITNDDVQKLVKERPVILCIQPHGVFSFGGCCAGVQWATGWWDPADIPTAAATSVLRTPILKHILGIFGLCDASSKSLTKRLGLGKSLVLYIGGIAELFLSSEDKEVLFARKRKGFIKLALRAGAEVVPIYFFGNTSVMTVLNTKLLRASARLTGVAATIFWGRWATPIPRDRPILGVIGRPLGIPATKNPHPSQEEIDEYHGKYLAEVTRIFNTYKKYNPDYKGKVLSFE